MALAAGFSGGTGGYRPAAHHLRDSAQGHSPKKLTSILGSTKDAQTTNVFGSSPNSSSSSYLGGFALPHERQQREHTPTTSSSALRNSPGVSVAFYIEARQQQERRLQTETCCSVTRNCRSESHACLYLTHARLRSVVRALLDTASKPTCLRPPSRPAIREW